MTFNVEFNETEKFDVGFGECHVVEGESAVVDQTFNPNSENAQSGKAVAEAIKPLQTNIEGLVKNKADKSTSLHGYGITDAYTKTEVENYVDEQTEIIKVDVEGLQKQINEEAHFRGYLSTNAKIQAMEATPNDFAYSAESGTKWVYDAEEGWKDTGTPVPDQLTPASDATPLINGEASPGQSEAYARGDHRHPTDTSRASVEEFNEFKTYVTNSIGDIESALDAAITLCDVYIGGAV